MKVTSSLILLTVCITAVLGMLGCSRESPNTGSNLLAPSPQGMARASTEPQEARIVIPFDPSHFNSPASNPYFPLTVGTVWSYVSQTPDGVETNDVEVTRDTKMILGVRTHVIRDRVYLEGSLTEDTFDWYAADNDGNVWYFGEDTKTYDHGVLVTTAGSWEAGKNGAQAGIIMLAHPQVGDTYHQENAPGVVADQARVKSLNETVTVPYGTFENCLKTQDWTPLEPGNRAFKYYASGVGVILEVEPHGGQLRVELVGVTTR